jgi:hypothetical protein
MLAHMTCLQCEQLAHFGRAAERVLQELGVDVERRCSDELAIYLREQERTFRQRAAVECRQPPECNLVVRIAMPDEDRSGELELELLRLALAPPEPRSEFAKKAIH